MLYQHFLCCSLYIKHLELLEVNIIKPHLFQDGGTCRRQCKKERDQYYETYCIWQHCQIFWQKKGGRWPHTRVDLLPKAEDMSIFVKKVQFKLHESYPNPIRIVSRPPYEIQETGWGEFEIMIKVFFQDPAEKPLTIYHLLKLFQTDPAVIAGKKNVVSEHYDEIVFTDPTNTMYNLLSNPRPS